MMQSTIAMGAIHRLLLEGKPVPVILSWQGRSSGNLYGVEPGILVDWRFWRSGQDLRRKGGAEKLM
jgi:hypothetical protein